ncbi:hypothetical protein GBA52_028877 [Prunus armeniaca]|nr:hypothetical protein GBA52_028877 [Prunus armeniaca]
MGGLQVYASGNGRRRRLNCCSEKHSEGIGIKKNLTDGEREILANLGTQLSTMISLSEKKGEKSGDIEDRLNSIQERVMSWEADQSMIWEFRPK